MSKYYMITKPDQWLMFINEQKHSEGLYGLESVVGHKPEKIEFNLSFLIPLSITSNDDLNRN